MKKLLITTIYLLVAITSLALIFIINNLVLQALLKGLTLIALLSTIKFLQKAGLIIEDHKKYRIKNNVANAVSR